MKQSEIWSRVGETRPDPKHFGLAVVLILFSTIASAQNQFIDQWAAPDQRTEVIGAAGANAFSAETDASAIGGEREQYVQIASTAVPSRRISLLADQALSFAEENDVNGFAVVIYDGDEGAPGIADAVIDNDTNDSDPFTPSFSPGLGGVDLLSTSCLAVDRGFTITASTPETDAVVTIDVFTSATAWSTFSHTKPANTPESVWFFGFSSFTQGAGALAPASFTDVNAIRIIINPVGPGNDFDISSPIATCGFDLGDAAATTNFFLASTILSVDSRVAANGPRHVIAGPRIGALVDAEVLTAEPNESGVSGIGAGGTGFVFHADAEFDDDFGAVPNDDDGVEFPPGGTGPFSAGDTFPVDVIVQNVGVDTPLLCGWIDFSDTETVAGFGFENHPDERVCVFVSQANPNPDPPASGSSCTDMGGGEFDCTLNFVIPTDWNGDNANPGGVDDAFLSRFRVTTDWASAADADFNGFASDGEVEDYRIPLGTLPVSIHSFDSRYTRDGLVVEWGTVSETHNIGFQVWGDRGEGLELLTEQLVPSAAADSVQPQRYSVTIPGVLADEISDLAITAIDTDGSEDAYGFFEAGRSYGKKLDPAPIAWGQVNQEVSARIAERSQFKAVGDGGQSENAFGSSNSRGSAGAVLAVDVTTSGTGLHQITWSELAAAGLDLTGVPLDSIAVTLKGKPVARDVVASTPYRGSGNTRSLTSARFSTRGPDTFGAGSVIRFWAEAPQLPNSLYLEQYSYRISVDATAVRPVEFESTEPKPGPSTFTAKARENNDSRYEFGNPLPDPWYAASVRADSAQSAYSTELNLGQGLDTSQAGKIEVVLGGWTAYDVAPDHRVQLELNGQILADQTFDGTVEHRVVADVPAGLLRPGANQVRVVAPGGTSAPFDIFLIDSIDLEYASALTANDDRLLVEGMQHTGGLTVGELTTQDTVAYAWTGSRLLRLERLQFGRGSVRVPTVDVETADYWVSSVERIQRPASVRAVIGADPLDGVSANLLVIAHPAFLPLSPDENHPLNDYLAARTADGWSPAVFDIEQIQAHYGHGMALPDAINAFLAAAERVTNYNHVLLVGSDSYDYRDHLGLGSLSFIPTHYAPTRSIRHTPSDNLLADLDGDGVADKAIGRWPVRTLADLSSIVSKTLTWSGDPQALTNAAWIADTQDPGQASFAAQVDSLTSLVLDAGWSPDSISQILLDEVAPPSGVAIPDAARQAYFDRLEAGRSLSGFVGHGAPSMWTFQGLLTPDDLNELYNEGAPTLIGTLTCYTTYFVSPFSDTVAHRWMNGYREDANGNAIAGVPNGAVAIHGAAALSNYAQNGWFAEQVLQRQLQGSTLGESIQQVRNIAGADGAIDQVTNWTLLGDPTLRLD